MTNLDLSNPQAIAAIGNVLNTFIGNVVGAFKRHPAALPSPAIAGRRPVLREQGLSGGEGYQQNGAPAETPANGETEHDEHHIAMNEAIYKEMLYNGVKDEGLLNADYMPAIQAVCTLTGAGFDNAGELLKGVADFVVKNPMRAMQLMKEIKKEANEPAEQESE
mgnify:CR=1 FL=1